MNKIFIIEHLEPELYEWCLIEYKHISKIVGKENLWFTNIRDRDANKLSLYGKVFSESVKSMELKNACILDPEAAMQLTPENSNPIEYFIFGGILGDCPPKKRTKNELSRFLSNAEKFNIGKEQMSTDNAVYTVKKIISGILLNKLEFQNNFNIQIDKIISTQLPYRYNIVNGRPLVSTELIKFIKKRDKI
ncbi:MAG: SAM-dependent methyltransferase [Nanoarchaeota archaeon]